MQRHRIADAAVAGQKCSSKLQERRRCSTGTVVQRSGKGAARVYTATPVGLSLTLEAAAGTYGSGRLPRQPTYSAGGGWCRS